MATEIILPRVDMDMEVGQIARWLADEGARVAKGQPLFEIETDKATMEIDAPASGIVRFVAKETGITLPVGSTVGWILAEDEAVPSVTESPAAEIADHGQVEPVARPEPSVSAEAGSAIELVRATPLARRLARLKGIDLSRLAGSGPRGRIQSCDVTGAAPSSPSPEAPAADPSPKTVAPPHGQPRGDAEQWSKAIEVRDEAMRLTDPRPGTQGAPLHCRWLREGRGRPVVAIHGFGADLSGWNPLLPGLSADVPVLGVDLPGHGRSAAIEGISLDAIATAIERSLGAVGVTQADLVGHSLGGAVVATMAARQVVTVTSLTLVSPAGLGPQINGDFFAGFLRARSPSSLDPWLRLLVSDQKALTPGLANAILRARDEQVDLAAQAHIAQTFFPDGTQAIDVRDALARVVCPTRLVFGIEDRIIPWRQAMGLPGAIALHLFPSTGHMPQVERSREIASIVMQARAASHP